MNPTLQRMIEIAKEASTEVMRVYEAPFSVDFKGPGDPITRADRIANDLICTRLAESFPSIPIVAEESTPEKWGKYRDAERVFFVDPVDGTREFVQKTGQFATMIGLVEGSHPTHGVLYAPAQQKLWAGVVGHGAFLERAQGDRESLAQLTSRPVSECRVVSSKSQKTSLNESALAALHAKEIIPMGSAGLKAMAIAEMNADIYLATGFAGCLWDSCAPEAILRALGGRYTDARGCEIDYRAAAVENNSGAVVAADELHSEVIDLLSLLFH